MDEERINTQREPNPFACLPTILFYVVNVNREFEFPPPKFTFSYDFDVQASTLPFSILPLLWFTYLNAIIIATSFILSKTK
jgi:hypothetical protein